MRLSDAIALGRTVVTPKAGQQFDIKKGSGCALGMAVIAIGGTYQECSPKEYKGRTGGVEEIHRWRWLTHTVDRPCDCFFGSFPRRLPRMMAAKDVVAHLFDRHVFGKKNWTLDQLIDYVRSIEPPEEAPAERAEQAAGAHVELVQ